MLKGIGITAIVALIIALLVCMPLATIWALNTLFGLSIVYTVKTWAATLVLAAMVGGTSAAGKS